MTQLLESGRTPVQVLNTLILEANRSADKVGAVAALPTTKQLQSRSKNLKRSKNSTWVLEINADLLNVFMGSLVQNKEQWDLREAECGADAMMVVGVHNAVSTAGDSYMFVNFTSPNTIANIPKAIKAYGGIVPVSENYVHLVCICILTHTFICLSFLQALADGKMKVVVHCNWTIIAFGFMTRYFSIDHREARTKFVPAMYSLTPKESGPVINKIKEDLVRITMIIFNLSISLCTLVTDPSPALRSGHFKEMALDVDAMAGRDFACESAEGGDPTYDWGMPSNQHVTDYAHVYRKVVDEEGYRRAVHKNTKEAYLHYMITLINACPSELVAMIVSQVATNELRMGNETKLANYLNRAGSGFFTRPWISFYCTAAWIEIKVVGLGIVLVNFVVAPSSQPLERFFKDIGKDVFMNARCSKAYLVQHAIPNMLTIMGHKFQSIKFAQIPSQLTSVCEHCPCRIDSETVFFKLDRNTTLACAINRMSSLQPAQLSTTENFIVSIIKSGVP